MNVTDFNAVGKPDSVQGTLFESFAASAEDLVRQLQGVVRESARQGATFDSVEQRVRQIVHDMGRRSLDEFVRLQGDGDLGERVETKGNKTLSRSPKRAKTEIRSIFGLHMFEQFTYAPGSKQAIALRPVSARMSLPARRWSYLLQELIQMLAVESSFEQATANLGTILGGRFSVDTTESINADMGRDAGDFLGRLPAPPPESEGRLLVASADGKGVPLVKEDAERVAAFETAKKRPGNRRMATVASVYSVDPHVRTAEEITAALFRDEPDETTPRPKRPRPQNKNTTAHFTETCDNGDGTKSPVSGILVAMAWIIGQIALRRRANQVLIVLMDGQRSRWDAFELHLSFGARTIPILDILHALTYVWKAAALFERDEPGRKVFTRKRLLRILRGEVRGVVRGLRRMGSLRGLSGKAARTLARVCDYLEKNADRMRYDEYLRRGYPIASGVIEGACRHLVKDRMERSGMRWTLEGARSMLNVRAAFQSDHWEAFLVDRIAKETKRLHRHRNLVAQYHPPALAC